MLSINVDKMGLYNINHKIWISLHALLAITLGNYPVPVCFCMFALLYPHYHIDCMKPIMCSRNIWYNSQKTFTYVDINLTEVPVLLKHTYGILCQNMIVEKYKCWDNGQIVSPGVEDGLFYVGYRRL